MAQFLLNDKAIRSALKRVAESGKPETLNDGGGLTLIVRPDGVGWWRLRYFQDTRENRLSLGTYPVISLAAARDRRDEARQLLVAGKDPSEERKQDKAARVKKREAKVLEESGLPGLGSFEFVAREWLAKVHRIKVSAGHADRTQIRLEQDAFPWIGRRPVGQVEPPELLSVIRKVEARGAIETAHRLKDACGQVFRYAIATGECSRNPSADLRDALQPVVARHLAAIIEPKAVGKLLRDMAAYQGSAVTRAALQLSALLLLRPGELRHMEWAWVDLEAAALTVPAEVMKRNKADKLGGPPHVVPLATQAVEILRELQPLTEYSQFVFPALTTKMRCMSENTVRSALRRLGYGNEDMTAHGFRATARTLIAERLGVAGEIIEAQLAHAVGDALGRAYNRTQFLEQRVTMMQDWANYLDRLKVGAEVIPIKSA